MICLIMGFVRLYLHSSSGESCSNSFFIFSDFMFYIYYWILEILFSIFIFGDFIFVPHLRWFYTHSSGLESLHHYLWWLHLHSSDSLPLCLIEFINGHLQLIGALTSDRTGFTWKCMGKKRVLQIALHGNLCNLCWQLDITIWPT